MRVKDWWKTPIIIINITCFHVKGQEMWKTKVTVHSTSDLSPKHQASEVSLKTSDLMLKHQKWQHCLPGFRLVICVMRDYAFASATKKCIDLFSFVSERRKKIQTRRQQQRFFTLAFSLGGDTGTTRKNKLRAGICISQFSMEVLRPVSSASVPRKVSRCKQFCCSGVTATFYFIWLSKAVSKRSQKNAANLKYSVNLTGSSDWLAPFKQLLYSCSSLSGRSTSVHYKFAFSESGALPFSCFYA